MTPLTPNPRNLTPYSRKKQKKKKKTEEAEEAGLKNQMKKWLEGTTDKKETDDAEEMSDKTVDKMTDTKRRKIDETWPIFGVKLK